MIEFSHLVFMAAARRSWAVYKTSTLGDWMRSYAGTPMAPIIEELHTKFQTEDLSFIDHWNNMHWTKSEHMMCFSLEGVGETQQFLGNETYTGYAAGSARMSNMSMSKVGVYCISPHPFVPPMMARFARHVVQQESMWLTSAGMDLHSHTATTAMHMPLELVAEGIPVIYGHRVDFTFEELETIGKAGGSAEQSRKPVSVTQIDDMVSRLYNRETRTYTDLGGTFQGEVRRTPR